ncbi:MAG: phosphoribosylanthranilate isomerase [Acidimicrobiia bacterium]|nr:phosphoribosylanthranilate isomerase [Acidimicrobiia bacterium]MYC57195.1 phosphoribosylanthranilate isomerase [Acidimicrobiia bacterium]MYG93878.1 phosphoribosylanthranilate isomerase [Acidimicrobiia bacterium]MYI29881.1 phosphoribosylanthranilate isomerase [Acidimicrobiia bacterium]
MFIKICGITNPEDALLATALGADALGFVFAPSPRQISPAHVQAIVSRLSPEVLTVGVFRNEIPERVVDITSRCGLKAVQLHGAESPTETRKVREQVPVVIKAFTGGSHALTRATAYGADMVLVDSKTPGSGQVFDWSLAENAPGGVKLIVAGGLTPDNVLMAIAKARPWGVDVSTGVEVSPGRKDPLRLRAFIKTVRQAYSPLLGSLAFDSQQTEQLAVGSGNDDSPYDWQEEVRP